MKILTALLVLAACRTPTSPGQPRRSAAAPLQRAAPALQSTLQTPERPLPRAEPLPAGEYWFRGGWLLPPRATSEATADRFVGPLRLNVLTATADGYLVQFVWQQETRQAIIPLHSGRPALCLTHPLRFHRRALRIDAQAGAMVYVFRADADTAWVGPSAASPEWAEQVPRSWLSSLDCTLEQPRWAPGSWPRARAVSVAQPPCLFAAPRHKAPAVSLPVGLPLWRRRQQPGWWQVQAWAPPWSWSGWLQRPEKASSSIETWQLRQSAPVGSWLQHTAEPDTLVLALRQGATSAKFAVVPWQQGTLLLPTDADEQALLPWSADDLLTPLWWRQFGDAACISAAPR